MFESPASRYSTPAKGDWPMHEPDRLLASSRHESPTRYPTGSDERDELAEAFQNLAPLGVGLIIAVVIILFLPGLIAPVFAAYGGFTLYSGLRAYQRRQVVLHTPTARVEAAPVGPAELSGRIRTGLPLTAPFSGKPCVFWRAEVWELQVSGSKRRWCQILFEEELADSFWLEDETGRIAVLPRGARLTVAEDDVLAIDTDADGEEGISAAGWVLLEAHGYRPPATNSIWDVGRWFKADTRLTIRELRLEIDGPVYVLGTIARAGDVRLPPRSPGGPVAHIHSDTYGDGFDTPLGRVSLGALANVPRSQWATVRSWCGVGGSTSRRAGGRQVGPARPDDRQLPPTIEPDRLVVWRGDAGCPFIIAGQEETELEQHLLANVQYGLTVGPGALLWGLWHMVPLSAR